MKIKISAVLTALLLLLCGCGGQASDNVSTEAAAVSSVQETAAQTSESAPETVTEASQEGLTDPELEDMAIVDDLIDKLVNSEEFQAAAKEERAEMSLELLNKLAESGTESHAYPLIKKESIVYEGGDIVGFQYSCGVLGGIMIVPFDPMMN